MAAADPNGGVVSPRARRPLPLLFSMSAGSGSPATTDLAGSSSACPPPLPCERKRRILSGARRHLPFPLSASGSGGFGRALAGLSLPLLLERQRPPHSPLPRRHGQQALQRLMVVVGPSRRRDEVHPLSHFLFGWQSIRLGHLDHFFSSPQTTVAFAGHSNTNEAHSKPPLGHPNLVGSQNHMFKTTHWAWLKVKLRNTTPSVSKYKNLGLDGAFPSTTNLHRLPVQICCTRKCPIQSQILIFWDRGSTSFS